MDTSMMVILIVIVFAALIAFVAIGQRKGGNAEPLPAAPLSAKEQAKRGRVEKAYLIGAGPREFATFKAIYRNGATQLETVDVGSQRYEEMCAAEPERLHLDGGWGNDISIIYQDGEKLTCRCWWMSWQAAQLRDELLQQNRRA